MEKVNENLLNSFVIGKPLFKLSERNMYKVTHFSKRPTYMILSE